MRQFQSRHGVFTVPDYHTWGERTKDFKSNRNLLVDESSRVATIGSCFAEELANSLSRLGIEGGQHPAGLFYNSSSVRQEIERIEAGREFLLPPWISSDGRLFHPLLSANESFKNVEEYEVRCRQITEESSRLFRAADAVVITLGLIEVWVDRSTGLVLRQIPHPSIFPVVDAEFRRLKVAEMIEDLSVIRDCLRRMTSAQLFISVSPIPLSCTFTESDVRVANSESKARIRAAVSEFSELHSDVNYFHSFEIVTSSERLADFMKPDGRHVHRQAVDYIIERFLLQFAGDRLLARRKASDWWLTKPGEKPWRREIRVLVFAARRALRTAKKGLSRLRRKIIAPLRR